MEHYVHELMNVDPVWVYVAIAAVAYIENIFPPFPSDIIVVAAGSMVGIGSVDFTLALFLSTVASTLGFATMYKIGDWFGDAILETGKIKFIPVDNVRKVEAWFQKYGYGLIVANRFLAGTRAVISFAAGVSELSLWKTVLLSFVSSGAWNFLLLSAGKKLGENWRTIGLYLETYSTVVTAILLVIVLAALFRWWYRRNAALDSSTHKH